MLEARISSAQILKKTIDAVKELVSDANFDCSDTGISLQAMDSSHVALVTFLMRAEGFENYRCDRSLSLGLNVNSFSKILRCAGNDDALTLKANDNVDTLNLTFESPSKFLKFFSLLIASENDRVCEYDLKLMDIDADHLGIPETDFDAVVKMSSSEFQRICRDMTILGETGMNYFNIVHWYTVGIQVTKEGVRFSVAGEVGNGVVMLKSGSAVDDTDGNATTINMTAPVNLSFSLKYLNNFTKATSLSDHVTLSLSNESPLTVEYSVGDVGYVRYYLAPKVEDDEWFIQ